MVFSLTLFCFSQKEINFSISLFPFPFTSLAIQYTVYIDHISLWFYLNPTCMYLMLLFQIVFHTKHLY